MECFIFSKLQYLSWKTEAVSVKKKPPNLIKLVLHLHRFGACKDVDNSQYEFNIDILNVSDGCDIFTDKI